VQLLTEEATVSTVPRELEELFASHKSMVFRTAYRVTGNASDAEDVLQTVFMRLLRRDESSAEMKNPESYLRRAAVNAALDIVRSRQAARSIPLEDMPSSAVCTELRELRHALRGALAKLAPRTAEIFALRFFEGHSNPEIAKMLNMSQIMVAVTVHRARKQLQKELGAAQLKSA
jgi:RNA polymerase sigma-70 factor, ECF subfamily